MRDVLDNDLAELYPLREADDLRLARLREQLFAERPRSRRWVGAAAVFVAVMLITGLVVYLRPARPADMASPATSLTEAAELLTRATPQGAVKHLRYEIWRTAVSLTGDPGAEQVEYRLEVWLPVEDGQKPRVDFEPTGRRRALPGFPEMSREAVQAQASSTMISFVGPPCSLTPCSVPDPIIPASRLWGEAIKSASSPLLAPFASNNRKAEIYRDLATLDAVRWVDGSVFIEGGTGTISIDPTTGDVSGYEERGTYGGYLPVGTVVQSVKVTTDWTDQRPS
ncbi:hypothetical protein [Lentzea sp. CA-135723]|uniref:hypothetical protein n=1 Tax=Lentzea sp. CA-135723 TaxID=3239950 RepID=UPI003D8D5DD2